MAGPDVFLGPTPEFPALMTGQLTSMRDNGTLTDFTITVQDDKTKLPCHKVILAIHSPYLTAMFTTDMVEAANNAVHFKDIEDLSFNTMKLILDYCYSEQIGFSSDQLISLIIASDYLQIERLKKRCVNAVKTFLNAENVLAYLTFSCEQHMKDLEVIKTWCLEIIVESLSEVSEQPAFLALTYDMLQECVKEVVRSDVTGDNVLCAICKWVNENVQSRGQYLEQLLQQNVQLDNCSLPAILHVMLTYAATIENCKVLDRLIKSVTKYTATINAATGKTFFNPENVLQHLTFAGEHGLEDIKTWCLEVVVNSFLEVYNLPAFLALSYDTLQDVMAELTQSEVESDDVLRAVFKWVNDDAESRGKHLEELLDKVQLDKCYLPALLYVIDSHETCIASNAKVSSILTNAATKLTAAKNQPTKKFLVVVGGRGADTIELNPTCWGVDTKAKTLTTISFNIPFDKQSRYLDVCAIPEGFALTGGEDSDMCVLFVASTMSWQKMPNMKRKRRAHGSIYIKGILYVIGGHISGNTSASVDCLTLASGQWESLPDVPIAVGFPNVAQLNGKAFMLDSVNTNKLYRFDVEKNEWKERASLPGAEAFNGASMIAVNGQLCVAGGNKNICAWYNSLTNMWSYSEQKPSKKHCFGSLVQVDTTTLMLLGGSYFGGTDEIEELNIEDGSWSVKELKMPAKNCLHKALILDIPQQIPTQQSH